MIYLDNSATTQVDPMVVEHMMPIFSADFANPSSTHHRPGRRAAHIVEDAQELVADILGVNAREIIFTSGATESCNLAIRGVWNRYQSKGNHIVTSLAEHKAVLDVCRQLEKEGAEVTYLAPNRHGLVDLDQFDRALRPDTVLACIMWANNETGAISPIPEVAVKCARTGTLLFSDATQAVGKIPVRPAEAGVHLTAFSAHKFYGPKGVGGLYVATGDRRAQLQPLIFGGGQQVGMRAGTYNTPGIAGMAKALELSHTLMERDRTHYQELKDLVSSRLLDMDSTEPTLAPSVPCLANFISLRINHITAEHLLGQLQNRVAIASGSACTSDDPAPSHVLIAMGLSERQAKSTIRISTGRFNTQSEVKEAARMIEEAVAILREQSPSWKLHLRGVI